MSHHILPPLPTSQSFLPTSLMGISRLQLCAPATWGHHCLAEFASGALRVRLNGRLIWLGKHRGLFGFIFFGHREWGWRWMPLSKLCVLASLRLLQSVSSFQLQPATMWPIPLSHLCLRILLTFPGLWASARLVSSALGLDCSSSHHASSPLLCLTTWLILQDQVESPASLAGVRYSLQSV